jgi:hypothetical protein
VIDIEPILKHIERTRCSVDANIIRNRIAKLEAVVEKARAIYDPSDHPAVQEFKKALKALDEVNNE